MKKLVVFCIIVPVFLLSGCSENREVEYENEIKELKTELKELKKENADLMATLRELALANTETSQKENEESQANNPEDVPKQETTEEVEQNIVDKKRDLKSEIIELKKQLGGDLTREQRMEIKKKIKELAEQF